MQNIYSFAMPHRHFVSILDTGKLTIWRSCRAIGHLTHLWTLTTTTSTGLSTSPTFTFPSSEIRGGPSILRWDFCHELSYYNAIEYMMILKCDLSNQYDLIPTVWGGRSKKRFCNMFSGSSPCLLGQNGSCSSQKLCYKTFSSTCRPTLYMFRLSANTWRRTWTPALSSSPETWQTPKAQTGSRRGFTRRNGSPTIVSSEARRALTSTYSILR